MKVEGLANHVLQGSSLNENGSSEAAGIQRQIQKVQEQISALSENTSMSPKEKQDKKKELEQQLDSLNKQLAQKQIEEKKAEEEKKAQKLQEQAERNQVPNKKNSEQKTGFSNSGMQAMIAASGSMNQAKALNHIKTQMDGESHALKGEIAATEARGGNPVDLKAKLEELEEKIGNVTADIVGKYGEANKAMSSSVSEEKINKEKSTEKSEKLKEEKKEDKDLIEEESLNDENKKREINILV